MLIELWIFIAVCVCASLVLAFMKEDSIIQIAVLIGSVGVAWIIAWQLNSAIFLFVGALLSGFIVKKYSFDEIKSGKKWFIIVECASVFGAIFLWFVDTNLAYGMAFVALVTLPSLLPKVRKI